MSYLVLARKWRPQVFEHLRGQEHIARALQNALRSGRIAHAYIFTGTRGVGKTSAARILSKALNCVEGPTPEPCNVCDACREITDGKYPDVLEIDGASNNSVDDVRKLRDQVRYPPVRGRYRVYIIDEVHMLSSGAFNALLKTLEEPPKHVVFIFATTDPHKVPITILSRCQQYDFKRLSVRELAALLGDICKEEGIAIEEAGLTAIAREAEGSVRDAQSLLDQVISYAGQEVSASAVRDVLGVTDRGLLLTIASATVQGDVEGVVKTLSGAEEYGFDPRRLAVDLLQVFRDLTILKTVGQADELVDLAPEEIAALSGLVKEREWEDFHARFDMLSRGMESLRTAPRQSLALEMILIKMARLPALIPITALSGHAPASLPPLGAARVAPPRPAPVVSEPPRPKAAEVEAPKAAVPPQPQPQPSEKPAEKLEPAVEQPPPKPSRDPNLPLEAAEALEAVREGIPSLRTLLADHARIQSWDPTDAALVLEVDPDYAFSPRTKIPEMVKILGELTGRKASVEITVTKGMESESERQKRETDLTRRHRREALDHPVIQKALDIFGGEVDEIKLVD